MRSASFLLPLFVHGGQVCKPAPGFPNPPGRSVTTRPVGLEIEYWDNAMQRYVPQGLVAAQALTDAEFEAMTHGPFLRSADVRARKPEKTPPEIFAASLPPTYFSATYADKFFLLDQINASEAPLGSGKLDAPWHAELKLLGGAVAPSTAYAINSRDGKETLQGFLIAEGNPFAYSPGNHTKEMTFGGLAYMDKDGCKTLFPVFPDPYTATGRVLNTIDCHEGTGMCLFSAWKFDGMGSMPFPDCLHYCMPDDMTHPTKCVTQGVVKDETGKDICREYRRGGGVHGLTIAHTDPEDPRSFEVFLVFTGGKHSHPLITPPPAPQSPHHQPRNHPNHPLTSTVQ